MKSNRGQTATEFILVLPVFLILLIGFVGLCDRSITYQLLNFAGFQAARFWGLYDPIRAADEVKAIHPKFKMEWFAKFPIAYALEGIQKNLNDKTREDNPIAYCGDQGEYFLCSPSD